MQLEKFEFMILWYDITIYYLLFPPFFSPFILVCEFSKLQTFVSERINVFNWNTCSALRVSGVLIPCGFYVDVCVLKLKTKKPILPCFWDGTLYTDSQL